MNLHQRLSEIKSQIDHGELLPIEVYELMLEAAEKQEPVAYCTDKPVKPKTSSRIIRLKKSSGFSMPLYAAPLPPQQVVTHDEYEAVPVEPRMRRAGDITLPGELTDEFKGE